MAFDGIVVSGLVAELKDKLVNGRIIKIGQPEKDELILTIKNYDQYKLFISASAGLPLIYLTESNKQSPMTAPNFCMLLRKHLNSARIIDITQPGRERVIRIKIEHLDDMGDLKVKYLIVEIMGKHSNIIFCDDEDKIIDSIKHVSGLVSSVREVLPGRSYFIAKTSDKWEPDTISFEEFSANVLKKPMPVAKALYTALTGFSPLIGNELCVRASIDGEKPGSELSETEAIHLYKNMQRFLSESKESGFKPNIVYDEGVPLEFSVTNLMCYAGKRTVEYNLVSQMLESFYSAKNLNTCIKQRSTDLRKLVNTMMERATKKEDIQTKQLHDTEKRDKYRIYGEMLTTYGYSVEPGAEKTEVLNYYTNENITIPLEPSISAMENAKKYFDRYSKLKRTFEAVTKQLEQTHEEIEHLDSIRTSLETAQNEEDLIEIKEEMTECGYIKKHYTGKKSVRNNRKSKPIHYISSDEFDIYVGKNNFQNDRLTFELAVGNDMWFHAKGIPGSHVIVVTGGRKLPDSTYEEAGRLAAYYSKGRENGKVEVDYTEKKNIKKPGGAKPGFVIYSTNYSMVATANIEGIKTAE